MAGLEIKNIEKKYGALKVIDDLNLEIPDGSFCVFVGPSGCGKSTLLRIIAGLETHDKGAVEIGGHDVTNINPANRGVAMVFQSYALYPHMTVGENVGFSLRMRGLPKSEIAEKVDAACRMLQLDHLKDRTPSALSGGQRQRVAIGRAIVRKPEVFLFDEPLSNLDTALRVEMRAELIKLHADLGATMVYVTHDQVEAMTMADRLVVLNKGQIEQVGDPMELYNKPANLFVATFLGAPKMNVISVDVRAEGNDAYCELPGGNVILLKDVKSPSQKGKLGIRPEHLMIAKNGDFTGKIVLIEKLGSETLVHVDAEQEDIIIVKLNGVPDVNVGDDCHLSIKQEFCHLFDINGRTIRNAL